MCTSPDAGVFSLIEIGIDVRTFQALPTATFPLEKEEG